MLSLKLENKICARGFAIRQHVEVLVVDASGSRFAFLFLLFTEMRASVECLEVRGNFQLPFSYRAWRNKLLLCAGGSVGIQQVSIWLEINFYDHFIGFMMVIVLMTLVSLFEPWTEYKKLGSDGLSHEKLFGDLSWNFRELIRRLSSLSAKKHSLIRTFTSSRALSD